MNDDLAMLMRCRQLKDELVDIFRKSINNESMYLAAKEKYAEYIRVYKIITKGKEPQDSFDQLYKKTTEMYRNDT